MQGAPSRCGCNARTRIMEDSMKSPSLAHAMRGGGPGRGRAIADNGSRLGSPVRKLEERQLLLGRVIVENNVHRMAQ